MAPGWSLSSSSRRTALLGGLAALLVAAEAYDSLVGFGNRRPAARVAATQVTAAQATAAGGAAGQKVGTPGVLPSGRAGGTAGVAGVANAVANAVTNVAPGATGATGGAATSAAAAAPAGDAATKAREIAELRYFAAHAPAVRQRYRAIAGPWAEAVATFATLYAPGEDPAAAARQRILGLLPPTVTVGNILLATPPAGAAERGAVWLEATLDLHGGDSTAFMRGLLALGEARNGMAWKSLTVAADAPRRTLHANGRLALLMVEQVE